MSDPEQGKSQSNTGSEMGFLGRFQNGGWSRIKNGYDLYVSSAITIALIGVQYWTEVEVVDKAFIQTANPLAISLIAFVLVGLSVIISFTDREFLALLNKLNIYDTLLFTFEFSIYLAISTSVVGILAVSYSGLLKTAEIGVPLFDYFFFAYLFLFVYMVLSISNAVSTIIGLGKKKARYDRASE